MSGTPLFNPNDNVTGRDGGPYLDEVEARNAEARRAVVEEREPDFENPPATAGMPLLSGARMHGVIGVNNLPSQSHRYDASNADLVQYRADDENEANFKPRGEIPEDFEPENVADEDELEDSPEGEEVNSHDPNYAGRNNEASDEVTPSEEDPEALNFDPTTDTFDPHAE